MSGPEETSESAVDSASPATDGAPTTPAPPSFGQAGAPAAETERAAPSFAVPLFGPDKPWWAATPDDDVEDDPEPETQADEPVPEPQAEDEPDAEPEVQAAAEEAPPAPEPPREDTRDEPPPEAAPGHLVAGAGAPEVDTRGAVPPPPVPDTPSPAYADTDPDGIPVYPGPQDDAEAPEETEPFRIEADDSEGALTPDAVLPPGVSPVEYVTPRHEGVPHTASATAYTEQAPDGGVILVVSQTQPDGVPPFPPMPGDQSPPPPPPPPGPAARTEDESMAALRRRNQLLIGMVAIVILIPATVLAAFGLASGGGKDGSRAADRPSRTATAKPRPARPAPRPTPVDINSEKTDTRPLALVEVFPTKDLELGGRFYTQDKSSVNHQCGLTARGAMIAALNRGKCRSVVRATYVNRLETIAITAGVAVMPDHDAALAANRAGRPAAYEWFRGMPGKRSSDIDRAGGHAAGTVRGRYIVYAYATYADGTVPRPGDQTLKEVAEAFVEYGLRPLDRRANGQP